MKNPNAIEDDIDRIRLKIDAETQNMSTRSFLAYYAKSTEEFVKKCGYRFVICADGKRRLEKTREIPREITDEINRIRYDKKLKSPDTIEDEIDRIRLKIYEETKHMTPAQRIERTNKIAETAAKKYGFKLVSSLN